MTGTEIQNLSHKMNATRLHGNSYSVGVQHANGNYAGPVTLAENDKPLHLIHWTKYF